MRPPGATCMGEFAAAICRADAATIRVLSRAALGAAPRPRTVAEMSRRKDLAVDHHRQEQECEVEQREFVDAPRRRRPIRRSQDSQNADKQCRAEYECHNEV